MVAARELGIIWGDTPQYWEWLSHQDSRFSEVAKLNLVWWFDIPGKIATRLLSKRSKYFAYLVYKLEDGFYGLRDANAVARFVDFESDREAEQRAEVVSFSVPRVTRGDFFNDTGEDGDVDAQLMEIRRRTPKGGLIVQGIEFRSE